MDKYQSFFDEYIAGYDLTAAPLWRKRNHTMRVMQNCRLIAQDLNLDTRDVEVAAIIGLFHDIGRFEQWSIYQSFSDSKTTDHANLSVKILRENNILSKHPDREVIISAIYEHNKYTINPKITNNRELTFCKLIRDADKLDIIREILTGIIALPQDGEKYSSEALKEIASHKLIDRSRHPDGADYHLASLALFNDIYFDYTRRCIRTEHMIEKMIERFIESSPSQAAEFHQLEKILQSC